MSEIKLAHLSFGDPMDSRNRFHETALTEARIATEHHEGLALAAPAQPNLVTRLRSAFAGNRAVRTEACSCPA